jgi:hypothetical protein
MPFPWRLLFFLSLLQASVFEISAKPKKEASDPTPPAPISARVRGYSNEVLTIVLQARGRIEEPLHFLIRKNPAKGSLSEIRRTGPKTAEVDYRPAADAPTGEFFFTFAAQSVDSPVSAPARIDIEINRRPAALEFAPQLDFGEVALGDSVRVNLIISNTGGLPAILGIAPQPPWHLPEPTPDRVDAGKQVVITFIFEPQQTGAFSERLVITPDKSRFAVLRGTGKQSLSWPAQGLIIASEERGRSDLSIAFQNLTASTRSVEFQWPENLIGPKKLEIPAQSTVPIPVSLAASAPPSFSFRGAVIFRSGNFSDSFPLTVHPAPPRLLITPQNDLDLGEAPLHETISGQFVVSNTGGLPAEVLMQVPDGLVVRPEPSGLLIAPSSSSEFEVSTSSAISGNFSQTLMIGPSDSQMQALKIQYAFRTSQLIEKVLSIPKEVRKLEAAPETVAAIPPVEECFLQESTSHSVTIYWKLTTPDTKDFLIERRVIKPGPDGRVVEQWEPWRQVEIQISGDTAIAHFRKLTPNSYWKIRIIGVDAKGLLGPPPPKNFRIATEAVNLWKIPFWIWMPSSLAMLLGFWFFIPQKLPLTRIHSDH